MLNRGASLLLFAVVVVALIYNTILGIRFIGIAAVIQGGYIIRTGKISYGWRGMPPSGYLSGWIAIGIGVLVILLGMVFVGAPELVEPLYRTQR